MITQLEVKNFRCFADHRIELPQKTLLVGKNNAGKSTCVEALRLVSLVTERLSGLRLEAPPKWTDLHWQAKGVSPSLEGIEIHKNSLFHNYGTPPALISATFTNGSRLDVHVGPEYEVHAVIYDDEGNAAGTRQAITSAGIPRVSILPQIGPLNQREFILEDQYVRSNVQTSLASLHLRNQLRILPQFFGAFQTMVSTSWPGIAVQPLLVPSIVERRETPISLFIREGDFAAEAAWMGHGLQMWLQTMWFLVRNSGSQVLILDEPDVYMHADLQRKLIRMLLRDPKQFIIATHSPEMLAEVEPDSVVILDRRRKASRAATSSKAVQGILQRVGSVHNLSLARLASQRRLLLVEGDDIALLKRVQNVIDPDAERPIDTVPNIDIEGWGGWHSALTLARFFDKNVKDELEVHCFLDRDYYDDEEIQNRHKEANSVGIKLDIWSVKELENFLIVPAAIVRVLLKKGVKGVDLAAVEQKIGECTAEMKDSAYFAHLENVRKSEKSHVAANRKAKGPFEKRWEVDEGRGVVSGKELMTALSKWAQDEHGITLSLAAVAQELRSSEIADELKAAIKAVTRR